ncbi:hypothetical protein An09g03690 [Aspergillus niger]|uniref:Uncharacterized protein n=2 Tax=Aspergillus niger TaxID=5061 RepID=A2QTY3_ASPNC|nr:hypothetical protein An09g03690 [Aspergillus niger]CAK96811.1 hypothetical protein An09g03690 [Aspergillus niger]
MDGIYSSAPPSDNVRVFRARLPTCVGRAFIASVTLERDLSVACSGSNLECTWAAQYSLHDESWRDVNSVLPVAETYSNHSDTINCPLEFDWSSLYRLGVFSRYKAITFYEMAAMLQHRCLCVRWMKRTYLAIVTATAHHFRDRPNLALSENGLLFDDTVCIELTFRDEAVECSKGRLRSCPR